MCRDVPACKTRSTFEHCLKVPEKCLVGDMHIPLLAPHTLPNEGHLILNLKVHNGDHKILDMLCTSVRVDCSVGIAVLGWSRGCWLCVQEIFDLVHS